MSLKGWTQGTLEMLPGEMKNIPVQDQKWISNTLFLSGKLLPDLKLWFEPPLSLWFYCFICIVFFGFKSSLSTVEFHTNKSLIFCIIYGFLFGYVVLLVFIYLLNNDHNNNA